MVTRGDIEGAIRALAKRRPVFHTEADFQHEFAWELRGLHPKLEPRLEHPVRTLDDSEHSTREHVDLLLRGADNATVVELKYWTSKLDATVDGERFNLINQSREPTNRFDFLDDVARCERLIGKHGIVGAFVIAVTNNPSYWKGTSRVGEDFLLSPDRTVTGTLRWGPGTSKGTKGGRPERLTLGGKHHLQWLCYSDIRNQKNGEFRYLLVDVGAGSGAP